jgi:hypothetical protein
MKLKLATLAFIFIFIFSISFVYADNLSDLTKISCNYNNVTGEWDCYLNTKDIAFSTWKTFLNLGTPSHLEEHSVSNEVFVIFLIIISIIFFIVGFIVGKIL